MLMKMCYLIIAGYYLQAAAFFLAPTNTSDSDSAFSSIIKEPACQKASPRPEETMLTSWRYTCHVARLTSSRSGSSLPSLRAEPPWSSHGSA